MRLVSFTVQRYRSISRAYKLTFGDFTVIIGPNNAGKSNVLRALHLGLGILVDAPDRMVTHQERVIGGRKAMVLGPWVIRGQYSWINDFPKSMQKSRPTDGSSFVYEFELTPDEMKASKSEVGVQIGKKLSIEIVLNQQSGFLRARLQGPGAKKLTERVTKLAKFIAARLDYEYIPVVRTAEAAEEIVSQMVRRALAPLSEDAVYQEATKKIEELEKPLLDGLSKTVQETLQTFLPQVRSVKVALSASERAHAIQRACRIEVDDGTPTPLRQKGDGVQSLAALGLIRKSSQSAAGQRNLVLAIEEPEAHLHPRAIHELRRVLKDLAQQHQLVISTHCPLLVNRMQIAANIVVNEGKASVAESIDEIRDVLGVKASDNLRSADLVLIVEGEGDARAMSAVLGERDGELRDAIDDHLLAIDSLGSGDNLQYKVTMLKSSLCAVHVWMDGDSVGNANVASCTRDGLLDADEVHLASTRDRRESEFEDLLDENIYADCVSEICGVSIEHPLFKGREKWSERIKAICLQCGKPWSDAVKRKLKAKVRERVLSNPAKAISASRAEPIDNLIACLKRRLATIKSG